MLKVGDEVLYYKKKHGCRAQWLKAVILDLRPQKALIKLDDGVEKWVMRENLKLKESKP